MEALERLRFESFVRNNPEVLTLFGEFVNSMVDAFPDDEFMEYYHSPQIVAQEQTTGTCICQLSDQCYLGFSLTTVSIINAILQHIGLK